MRKISKRMGVAVRDAYAALLFLLAATAAATIRAEEVPPYQELLQQSLSSAPILQQQEAYVRAARAEADQARLWLNPSVSASYENIDAPKSGGVSQRQDTFTVTQPFEIGGKRAARIEVGDRNLAAADARNRHSQINYSAELALAYATAEAAQIRRSLASEELTRANDDLRIARVQVKAGREAELRVAQALASFSAAQAAEETAKADQTEALERLSALVGVKSTYTIIAHSFLNSLPAYRSTTARNEEEAPAIISAAAERDALEAQVRVEEKRWIPDLGLNVGKRKYAWSDDGGLVVGISATIPLFDQNRHGVDAARARASAAEARLEASRLETVAARRSALAQVAASEKRLAAAIQGEGAAAEAYRLGRIGYDAGKNSLLELLVIRRALTDAKLSTIDARLAQVRALASLSKVDGQMLFGESK